MSGAPALSRLQRVFSTDFLQPAGQHVDVRRPRGYHIDLRIKAPEPAWPTWWLDISVLHVGLTQYGLACFERYVAGEGEQWLEVARKPAERLLAEQEPDGGWSHEQALGHTFPLRPGWRSGMAQGQAASLLVRLHLETGEARWAEAALRALEPLRRPPAQGGALAALDGRPFYEEYPTDPPSFVLNGGLYALYGLYDVATGLGDARAREELDAGVALLDDTIDRWDTGWWSLYDLFPGHRMPNVASLAYHRLHVDQLTALLRLAPAPRVEAARDRWRGYLDSPVRRARAFAAKSAFRVIVPRRATVREAA